MPGIERPGSSEQSTADLKGSGHSRRPVRGNIPKPTDKRESGCHLH